MDDPDWKEWFLNKTDESSEDNPDIPFVHPLGPEAVRAAFKDAFYSDEKKVAEFEYSKNRKD